jgi:hypothetical protein
MSEKSLQVQIEEMLPELVKMASELSFSNISTNFKFILSEIKDSTENFSVQRARMTKENDKKTPQPLEKLMPVLDELYENLYDINLHIYKANRNDTVIDMRYYPKSALDEDYRKTIVKNPPMLHAKVEMPPQLTNRKEKFDINWHHHTFLNEWKLFWMGRLLWIRRALRST